MQHAASRRDTEYRWLVIIDLEKKRKKKTTRVLETSSIAIKSRLAVRTVNSY